MQPFFKRPNRATALAYLVAVLGSGLVCRHEVGPRGLRPLVLGVLGVSRRGAGGGSTRGLEARFSHDGAERERGGPIPRAALLELSHLQYRGHVCGSSAPSWPASRSACCAKRWHRAWSAHRRSAAAAASGRCRNCRSSRKACRPRSSIAAAISNTFGSASRTPTGSGCPPNKLPDAPSSRSSGREAFEQLRPRITSRCLPVRNGALRRGRRYSRGSGRRWMHVIYTPTLVRSDGR